MRDTNLPYIGVIPDSWKLALLGRFASEVQAPNSDCAESNALQFKMGSIISKSVGDSKYHPETLEGYNVVLPGDIIINGLNLNYDLKSLRVGQVVEKGVITAAYIAIRPHGISTGFLKYLLKGFDYIKTFHGMGKGIRLTLSYGELKKMFIPVPPIEVQQRIADFLDAKCAEIDTILEQTRESIDEYKKLKQSVITEAVTKGICGERPMKDSGVEWIGPVPLEWDVCRLKYRITLINGRAYSDSELLPEGKYMILRVGNLFTNEKWYYSDMELAPDKYCEKGDLLYAWSASFGPYIWSGEKVIYHYHIWKAKLNGLERDYAYYTLMAFTAYKKLDAHGTAMVHLTMANMNKSSIPVPTITEQQEIAAYLDEKCAAIDSLIASKEALITELEAYKKSIIYEYVTGKKEVI